VTVKTSRCPTPRPEGGGMTPFGLTFAEPAKSGRVALPGREELDDDTTTVSATAPNNEDVSTDDS